MLSSSPPLDSDILSLWSSLPEEHPTFAHSTNTFISHNQGIRRVASAGTILPSEGGFPNVSSSPGSIRLGGREGEPPRIQKRLARKAELARESRKRKKAYIEELEEKIDKLQYRISELEERIALRASIGGEDMKHGSDALTGPDSFGYHISDVDSLSENELATVISNFEKVTLSKRLEIEENLNKVRHAINPSRQMKFILWAFDQKESFYDNPGLWQSLLRKELQATDFDIEALKCKREMFQKDKKVLSDIDSDLARISGGVNEYFNQLGMLIVSLGSIMSRKQLTKFIAWVENSDWCMQMLDSLWADII